MRRRLICLFFVCLSHSLVFAEDQKVQITGFASFVGMKSIPVAPVDRTKTASLIDGGAVETDGFTGLVINVAGQVEGTATSNGVVGAILIPDIAPYDFMFKTIGLLPASIEVTIPIEPGQQYFWSKQARFDVGFPRYRVFFYNSVNTGVRVSFFAYRTR